MANLLKRMLLSQLGGAFKPAGVNKALKTSYVTSGGHNSILYVHQKKDFLAKGLLWDFYVTTIGEDMTLCWRTSGDAGISWSAQTATVVYGYPEDIALYTDGNYIYITRIAGSNIVKYQRGLLNVDGTITFTPEVTAQTIFVPDYPYRPNIAVDSSGYPYIGYTRHIGANDRPFIIKSSTNDGTWVMDAGYPRQLNATSSTQWRVRPLPRIGDDMIAFYIRNGFLYMQPYESGVGWGAEEGGAMPLASSEVFDAVSDTQNGDAWLVATEVHDTGRYIWWIVRHDDGSAIGDYIIDADATIIQFSSAICPGLCLNRISPTEVVGYVFWLGEPTANHVFYERVIAFASELGYVDLAAAQEAFQAKNLFQVIPHSDDTIILLVYGTSATGRKLYSVTFPP